MYAQRMCACLCLPLSPRAVACARELGVHRQAHDAGAAEGWEVRVLELLADGPRDEVALRGEGRQVMRTHT